MIALKSSSRIAAMVGALGFTLALVCCSQVALAASPTSAAQVDSAATTSTCLFGPCWSNMAGATNLGGVASSVSCTSTQFCMAVGGTVTTDSTDQPTAGSWNGATWSNTVTPSPSADAVLTGVSCNSPTLCLAVGVNYIAVGEQESETAFSEEWNGANWSLLTVPSPMTYSALSAPSCTSPTFCVAVGATSNSANGQPIEALAEVWNGTNWSVQSFPNIAGSDSNLLGVSCDAATFCMAIGNDAGAFSAYTWNGLVWSQISTPAVTAQENRISCVTSDYCAVVGYSRTPPQNDRAIYYAWNGTGWKSEHAATNPVGADPSGVSCVSAKFCFDVGQIVAPKRQPIAFRWNGSLWSSTATKHTGSESFSGVSCVSTTFCVAVGAGVAEDYS